MADRFLAVEDYVVFALTLVLSTAVGVYYAWKDRKAKDNKQYLSADGQLGVIPVSLSLIASFMSSQTILGMPSETYTHGTALWSSYMWMIFSALITNFVFLPVFYKAKFTSVHKYCVKRYQSTTLRLICSFVSCLSMLFQMGVVLYGPALAISSVTNFNLFTILITLGVICTFYTTIGGLKAVILTDTIQMVIMFAGLMTVLIKISVDKGGLGTIWKIASEGDRISQFNFVIKPFNPVPTFFDAMSFGLVTWTSIMAISQTSIQRFCSMKSIREARMILCLNVPGIIITASLAALCGLSLYAHYRDCDPRLNGEIKSADQLMPYYVLESLSYGIPGLFISCVFSGSLSTLSSGYTSLSAIFWGDFLKPLLKFSGKKELIATKLTAAFFGLLSIAVAFLCSKVKSIIQASAMMSTPLASILFAVYLTAFVCPFVNKKGAIFGIVVGSIWAITVGIGGILTERKQITLYLTTIGCPNSTNTTTTRDFWFSSEHQEQYIPSDFTQLFYISPYLMSPVAFGLTTATILVTSLITGGARFEPPVDPDYIFKPILSLNSLKMPKVLKSILCPKVIEKPKIESQDKVQSVMEMNSSTQTLVMENKDDRNRY